MGSIIPVVLQPYECCFTILPGIVYPDKTPSVFVRDKGCGTGAVERIEDNVVLVGEEFQEPAREFFREHGRVMKIFHPYFRRE